MNATDEPPARIRIAIALSIAAHLCALWLLAVVLDDRLPSLSSEIDSDATAFLTTIEYRDRRSHSAARYRRAQTRPLASVQPRQAAKAAPTPAARPSARATAFGPAISTAGRQRLPRDRRVSFGPKTSAPRPTLALAAPTPTPTPTLALPTAVPAIAPATPSPIPSATPPPPAVVAANFGGLFSQNYPPAIAPSDLSEIRALLDGPAHIRVNVDETGQATDVQFVGPVADPQIEQEVRGKLLAFHYVPADCNGLHCEGTLKIEFR
jgi:hypothetical protein